MHCTRSSLCCLGAIAALGATLFAAVPQLPPVTRTPQEQKKFEARLDWFYKAKYGVMFHYVANMMRFKKERLKWTSEKWDAWVDAVDVEVVAAQAAEIGAGYVVISLGQKGGYYCSPNPVYEKYWGAAASKFGSKRDLPMDLYKALKKRGIRMMLYTACTPYAVPGPDSERNGWTGSGLKFKQATPEGQARWIESLQWYSDHYGEACAGWWLDGLKPYGPDYRQKVHQAVRHGNPDALTASGTHALSDYTHGHCVANWAAQQKRLPNGRWDAEYRIQWHAFQYLGRSWAARGTAHSTKSLVNYATKVISRGGAITFDVGVFEEKPRLKGPYLRIDDDQMKQLRAVRDAVNALKTGGEGPKH